MKKRKKSLVNSRKLTLFNAKNGGYTKYGSELYKEAGATVRPLFKKYLKFELRDVKTIITDSLLWEELTARAEKNAKHKTRRTNKKTTRN